MAPESSEGAHLAANNELRPTSAAARLRASGSGSGAQTGASLSRAASSEMAAAGQQEIFALPRQKSRAGGRERRESRMFLVDGQLCWTDDQLAAASFTPSKRNSSIGLMFGSSMDLSGIGQSMDSSGGAGSGNEEAISYRIKWCRENIIQLKRQTWPMEKKLQVLRASKMFIKQHQGELKQSKQAKDVLASTSAIFERYWRHFKREMANFLVIITPWEMRIKKIESHFGSVVASYFTFLRWIFWLNLANSLVMVSFVMVPELIENVPDPTGMRKGELGMQQINGELVDQKTSLIQREFNPTLGEMWEFEGFLKFSPIFYGYYSNVEISRSGFWRNPLAFLLSAMLTYLFCFFCISRKLSQNTKLSRIGTKDDEYTFCWTVFVGWDFMIGNSETAYNKTSSLVMNLKEGILEEKEQTKDRDWRLIIRRVMANLLTLMLIVASAYVVTLAVQRSENLPDDASLLQKNELQLVMSGIQFMFPPLFDVIGIIEKYHPRKALSWQLGRILFLDFLNFYTLMFSLFGTVDQMGNQLNEVSGNITLLRKNATYYNNLFTTTTTSTTTTSTTTTTTTTTPAPALNTITNSAPELSTHSSTNISTQSVNASEPLLAILNGTALSGGGGGGSPPKPSSALAGNLSASDLVSGGQSALNATTSILTSVLLASSTIMPSTNSNTSTTFGPPTLQTSTPSAKQSLTNANQLLSSTSLSATAQNVADTSASLGATTTISSPQTPTMQKPPVLGQTNPPGDTRTSTSTSTSLPVSTQEDEDYPDIGQGLATGNSGARRKRAPQDVSDDWEEWDNSAPQAVEPRSSAKAQQQQLERRQNHRPPAIAWLPPIQDPYRKNGLHSSGGGRNRNKAKEGTRQGNEQDGRRRGGGEKYEEEEEEEGEEEDGEEEEEPLEGRLEPSMFRKVVASNKNNHYPSTTTRRPGAMQKNGLARPIGVSNQTQSTRPPPQAPSGGLNSDREDEVAPPLPADGGSATPVFVEPTTGGRGDAPAQSLSLDNKEPATASRVGAETELEPNLPSLLSTAGSSGGTDELLKTTTTNPQEPSLNDGQTPPIVGDQQQIPDNTLGPASDSSSKAGMATLGNSSEVLSKSQLLEALKANNLSGSELTARQDCVEIPDFKSQEIVALNSTLKDKLKTLCWETMFGQEMVKIVVMDLVMTVVSAVSFEFMRACFVRYCNRFFFWDLERGFPGYQDFKIAENVLHLVNNQSTVWMGMFFAPGLPAINTVKLAVLMYVRSWAVLTCNIPHETVFKVSKSNNFYYWILLINLLICILPVAYAVTWIRPSWHCGPFGGECRMYLVVTKLIKQLLPPEANSVFRYLTSPGAVIPILISLILIIYYLASTVSSSKEANKELKAQLKKDKEQEANVPEITNTTVADQPTCQATAAAAVTATTGATAATNPLLAPNTNSLIGPASTGAAPALVSSLAPPQPKAAAVEPKSLLAPPSP